MASTYHSFDRYRSTTNSYIEKQTAYGMIWLRHIISLIHIDKIIGEVLERQHGIILIPEYLSVGWQVSIGEVHILLKSTTPIDSTHAIPIEIPIGYQWGIIPELASFPSKDRIQLGFVWGSKIACFMVWIEFDLVHVSGGIEIDLFLERGSKLT